MNCMKCGRETVSEQVFCEECLLEMEKHPVKPGTVVLLPRRKEAAAPKKTTKRRAIPLEDQVKLLKKRVKIQLILLIICIGLLAITIGPAVEHLKEDNFKMGQNYSSISSTSEPSEQNTP